MFKIGVCYAVSLFWAINANAQTTDPVEDSSTAEADADQKPRRSSPAVVLRAGMYTGNGTSTASCTGSDCADESNEVPYDDVATPAFMSDVLFNLNLDGSVRVGGSLGVVPFMKIQDLEGESDMGALFSIGAPAEMLVEVGPKATFVLRVQLDALVLVPGGELEEAANDISNTCGQCKVDGGPYFGMAGGIGAGFMAETGSTRLRADVMFQGYSIKTLHTEYRTLDADIDLTFAGLKVVAMAGIEL